MEKFNDIAYRYIKHNKKRSFSIVIAIMISVSLIFGIGTFGLSVYNGLLDNSKAIGDYVVVFNNVSTNVYDELKENDEIDNICAIDILKVAIPQKKGEAKTLVISEFDDLNQNVFSYSLVEGSYPKNSDQIMIENKSKYRFDENYKIGDDIKLNIGEEQKNYKITGFFTSASSDSRNTNLSAVTIRDNEISDLSNIYIDFKNHRNIKETANDISSKYGINILNYNEDMMSLYGQSSMTERIKLLIFLCCCLLIFFSQLIIRNTIHMSVLERTKDFGILRCIGISQRKLKKILYKEAFILGIVSIVSGIALSYIVLKIAEMLILTKANFGEYFKIELYPSVVIISVILVAVSLILALFEPRKILKKISPLEAIRSSFAIKKEVIKRRKIGSSIFGSIFGIEGQYAYKNIMRNKGSFVTILIAFTISISLFTAFNGIFKTMLKDYDDQNIESSSYYDAYIYLENGYENKVSIDSCLNELSEINGVEDVKPSYSDFLLNTDIVNSLSKEYKEIEGESINDAARFKIIKGYENEELNCIKENVIKGNFDPDNLKDDEVIIASYGNLLDRDKKIKKICFFDINVGDQINIKDKFNSEESNKVVKVVAIINGNSLTGESPAIIFSKDAFMKITAQNSNVVQCINIKLKNSEISRELEGYIKSNPQYEDIQYYNPTIGVLNQIKSIKMFTNILLIVIGIISAINILNSMASKQILRKKEFALLRVVGMSKKKLCKMIVLENSLVLIISSILGIIIGNLIGYSFVELASTDNDIKYIIPILAMFVGIMIVVIMALIFSVVSVAKIGKQNIVEDIKDGGI